MEDELVGLPYAISAVSYTHLDVYKRQVQYRLKWVEHLKRMDDHHISKQILNYKPNGRRRLGCSKKLWRDQAWSLSAWHRNKPFRFNPC